MIIDKIRKKLNQLNNGAKIRLAMAVVLTLAIVIAVPILAWFSYQRQIGTVAKINSPAKLAIKSGYNEDIIQFKMSGIDVGNGTTPGSQDFVFCVEGEDVRRYNLQIAHTTNIKFTYTLYRAHSDPTGTADEEHTAVYKDKDQIVHKYKKASDTYKFEDNASHTEAYGGYINANSADGTNGGRITANGNYIDKSYSDTDYSGNRIQYYAEPLYWQTKSFIDPYAIDSTDNNLPFNELEDEGYNFLNYYVLNVSWRAGDIPETDAKETDLIYITAQIY